MKHIDFELNGDVYALSFTTEALFTVYDKFGYTSDVLGTTKALEPSVEGWKNCCWLAALMASQGELQRRYLGHEPRKMITMEDLRLSVMPADAIRLRQAVRDAMEQGFQRDIPDQDPVEVNLVLMEREEAEKKSAAAAIYAFITSLSRLRGLTSVSKKP